MKIRGGDLYRRMPSNFHTAEAVIIHEGTINVFLVNRSLPVHNQCKQLCFVSLKEEPTVDVLRDPNLSFTNVMICASIHKG
jgi:hypothetical protein